MDNIIKTIKPLLEPKEIDPLDEETGKKKTEKQIKIEKNNDEVELRIKNNLVDGMIKKFHHTIERFQEVESEIRRIKETKLIRGAEIALEGRQLDEEERQKIIEEPQLLEQIYENKLKQKAHRKLISVVQDLEERHQDIKKLQKTVLEVHKMTVEMHLLVKYQGEMIDNIVLNIKNAKNHIDKGNVELDKGKKCMECKKKIKCIIMIVVIAILLIILIPIIVAFAK